MQFFFFQADDGIRDGHVTGVQTCALPIYPASAEIVEQSALFLVDSLRWDEGRLGIGPPVIGDRKSTRLNSSHVAISYAVFCLKKKKQKEAYKNSGYENEYTHTAHESTNETTRSDL